MRSYKTEGLVAIAVAFMMALPGIPAIEGSGRESPNIVFNVNTFADGNSSSELVFTGPGDDTSLGMTLPNGAKVLDARMNISAAPLTSGGTDCPRNVTVDVGNDGVTDWAFRGKGYGDMGHQYMFDTGANSSSPKSGDDGTSTSHIQLPASAKVKAASCNVTSTGVASTVTLLGGINAVQSPFNIGQYRMQWLWNSSEMGRSGVVDKIGWRVYSGTGSGTLSNFKLLLGHTTLEATTDTFDNNWGGETPTTVIDTDNYNYWDTNGWIVLDIPNVFVYNNTKNLLIEMSFSARAGTNYLLYFYYMTAGSGTRRLYDNVDYTSPTGILDDPSQPLHYDFTIDFASDFGMTLDLGGDSAPEYVNDNNNWNATPLDITGALSAYMEQATANFTDVYGNGFAQVPIVAHTELGGGINISNLTITYDYTALINEHPAFPGGLAEVLDDLLPYTLDGNSTTLPVTVSSVRAGRISLSNLSIDYRPPIHDPVIDYRDPGQESVVMNENESRSFSIKASDEYGYPLGIVWFVDTLEVARNVGNITFVAEFESSGNHAVSVNVENTMRTITARWNITVLNVNRPPVVDSFTPASELTIREEESLNLGVVASDPDSQDRELRYTWYIGAIDQNVPGDTFRFKTTLSSAGVYSIRVKVSDEGGLSATQSWKVTVDNVNVLPVVDKLSPSFNPSIKETETASFSISATDFDRQTLTYRWLLDGAEAGVGQQYTFRAGYDAAGVHLVEVIISDGEANISRNWTVTVENLNRAPIPFIDRPAGQLEFIDTDLINFSGASSMDPDGDALKFKWLEGSKELATTAEFEMRFTPGVHEMTLEVTDSNRAVNRTSVKFTVRYVKLKANLDRDVLVPVEGNMLTFTAYVNNTGDAPASSVSVELQVDGQSLGTQTIESIAGGGSGSATFTWKAKKGEHTLTVKAGGQSWNSTVTVEAKPPAPAADNTWLYGLVAVVAVAAVAGGLFMALGRRKRAPHAPETEEAPAPKGPAPSSAKAKARAAAAAATPVAAPSAKDAGDRDRAQKLIVSTQEKVADLIENPEEGVDVTTAMDSLDMAQEALKQGDTEEALRLAELASASLAAKAAPPAKAPKGKPPVGEDEEEEPEGEEEPEDEGETRTCEDCGEKLEPGWGVCPTCGKTV